MPVVCNICPHRCKLSDGQQGICRARECIDGKIVAKYYGKLSFVSLDPIEKKPLRMFMPGSMILSVGSLGCNMRCQFCQNHEISQDFDGERTMTVTPVMLAEKALELKNDGHGNIGVAYTYNEPFVSFEYMKDCSELVNERNLKNVIVTNGIVNDGPLDEILKTADAMNIDLKTFNADKYRYLGGDLETVKETILRSMVKCHVEVTTLIVPGISDDREEFNEEISWLASADRDLPLHISRFFPRYRMSEEKMIPIDEMYSFYEMAREKLNFVFLGNC
jgi:pyruvate formate lyase activating enzyme